MWEKAEDISRDCLLKRVKGKNGLLVTLTDKVDRELLEAAGSQLKIVSTLSVGYDHIDVDECRRRGVLVGNTPDVLTDAVAELTMALLLATLRRFFEAHKALRDGMWKCWGHFFMCGGMVKGSVVGFVGAGRIGASIMQRLVAFQPAQVLYNTRNRSPAIANEKEYGAVYCSALDDLLARSDIVIVCCSLNSSTKHLLGEAQFRQMKPSAILINTSRGAVVDQKALYEALKSKQIAAAGLDVMEVEPMPTDDPLLELDNVVLLPHIGSATFSTREAMIRLAVDNLHAGLDGRPLPAAVA
ncbi:PREDICTED: glyoxylate reductase/hydroxypyruvate reductase-like [Rhagoletis zephyria]|uniref:glyoxylate reductase/hydroxypyruvate reductase-like n=1 Tax=Rhagoletis zephyria TaxID=28612 RepID=UPI0008119BAB|nr:PREDICTED: glyoxylate reductase/hydroxypyruvate reductase-like [Rhagoletis zephyria]